MPVRFFVNTLLSILLWLCSFIVFIPLHWSRLGVVLPFLCVANGAIWLHGWCLGEIGGQVEWDLHSSQLPKALARFCLKLTISFWDEKNYEQKMYKHVRFAAFWCKSSLHGSRPGGRKVGSNKKVDSSVIHPFNAKIGCWMCLEHWPQAVNGRSGSGQVGLAVRSPMLALSAAPHIQYLCPPGLQLSWQNDGTYTTLPGNGLSKRFKSHQTISALSIGGSQQDLAFAIKRSFPLLAHLCCCNLALRRARDYIAIPERIQHHAHSQVSEVSTCVHHPIAYSTYKL